jgi:uncharacterized peroxidase-related enzyme
VPRIAPIDPATADPRTASTLEAVKQRFGTVPNVFRTLAHSPTALHGYLGFTQAAESGRLDARQREIVALAVAQANGCGYCLAAHTMVGRAAGLDDASIARARSASGDGPGDEALAAFARRVVEARGWVEDADLERFLAHGFEPGDAIEVVALVAMNTLTNYVNHLADTEVDFPRVPVSTGG